MLGPINRIFELLIFAIFVIFAVLAVQEYCKQKQELRQQSFSVQGAMAFGGFKPVLIVPDGAGASKPPESV